MSSFSNTVHEVDLVEYSPTYRPTCEPLPGHSIDVKEFPGLGAEDLKESFQCPTSPVVLWILLYDLSCPLSLTALNKIWVESLSGKAIIIANKADKCKQATRDRTWQDTGSHIGLEHVRFSVKDGTGQVEVLKLVKDWLAHEEGLVTAIPPQELVEPEELFTDGPDCCGYCHLALVCREKLQTCRDRISNYRAQLADCLRRRPLAHSSCALCRLLGEPLPEKHSRRRSCASTASSCSSVVK
ncbi:uncharacterized protein B0I36DRAFT_326244 [Microdochium trichocladiopsis]|uniref:Uncharacterized protein n=1 Tax=Microdochium trichocladiopsis TaxID=1682393 RepID=A0A9P8Y514_9PEZI|nr:uncharacterized protein B0I36DRAFT_326244 [Microdochium trichocladiopsis]KAH7029702.1 hypothetical protein B0I36DRAFT_326244 [Microdochium trichocladiopsis]